MTWQPDSELLASSHFGLLVLCWVGKGLVARMTKADIKRKAIELCERDGYSWEVVPRSQFRHDPPAGIPLPTDEMREAYITRAERLLVKQRDE